MSAVGGMKKGLTLLMGENALGAADTRQKVTALLLTGGKGLTQVGWD